MYKLHTLQQDKLLSLPARRGAEVSVEAGAIWFTLDGRDVVLSSGQSCQLEADATLLIESFSYSSFRLAEPAAPGWIKMLLNLPGRFSRRQRAARPINITGSVKA